MKLKPILRNEEGASPGGGAAPAQPQPAAQQGAQQAAPAIPVDVIKGVVTEALTAALPELRNGIFADLRRDGAFRKDKPVEHPTNPTPQHAPGAPAPAAGLSVADVEAMLERERVIASRAAKHDLNDNVVRRMKSALNGVEASRFAAEADSFLSDLGLVKAPTQQPAAPASAQPQPSNPQPLSDKGAPVPGGVLDWEREFQENPIGMSAAARRAMDAKHGADKGRAMRLEAARQRAGDIRVLRPQG